MSNRESVCFYPECAAPRRAHGLCLCHELVLIGEFLAPPADRRRAKAAALAFEAMQADGRIEIERMEPMSDRDNRDGGPAGAGTACRACGARPVRARGVCAVCYNYAARHKGAAADERAERIRGAMLASKTTGRRRRKADTPKPLPAGSGYSLTGHAPDCACPPCRSARAQADEAKRNPPAAAVAKKTPPPEDLPPGQAGDLNGYDFAKRLCRGVGLTATHLIGRRLLIESVDGRSHVIVSADGTVETFRQVG